MSILRKCFDIGRSLNTLVSLSTKSSWGREMQVFTPTETSTRPPVLKVYFFGPDTAAGVTTWEQAKRWFNFGLLSIDSTGNARIRIKNTNGETVFDETVQPNPKNKSRWLGRL